MRKISNIRLDPIKVLTEPCANKIFKVSKRMGAKMCNGSAKRWRDFIKVRSGLMGKLRLNTILLEREEHKLRQNIFNEKNKRTQTKLQAHENMLRYLCTSLG